MDADACGVFVLFCDRPGNPMEGEGGGDVRPVRLHLSPLRARAVVLHVHECRGDARHRLRPAGGFYWKSLLALRTDVASGWSKRALYSLQSLPGLFCVVRGTPPNRENMHKTKPIYLDELIPWTTSTCSVRATDSTDP